MEKEFVMTITYNFDGGYVAKCFASYEEATECLKNMLQEEIDLIKNENEYNPSVLEYDEDDIILVYAEGFSKEYTDRNYALEDCAYYRVVEVK